MQAGPIVRKDTRSQFLVPPGFNFLKNTVTLAEVNASKLILPPSGAFGIQPVWFIAIPNGAFATLTDIRLSTNEATPVDIVTLAVAQLTDGAVLVPGATGVTLGAGFGVVNTRGFGVQVRKTGSAGITATGIDIYLFYAKQW